MMRSFIVCIIKYWCCYDDQVKEDKVVEPCSTHGEGEKCI
jgi:hypothetical protein